MRLVPDIAALQAVCREYNATMLVDVGTNTEGVLAAGGQLAATIRPPAARKSDIRPGNPLPHYFVAVLGVCDVGAVVAPVPSAGDLPAGLLK